MGFTEACCYKVLLRSEGAYGHSDIHTGRADKVICRGSLQIGGVCRLDAFPSVFVESCRKDGVPVPRFKYTFCFVQPAKGICNDRILMKFSQ